VGGLHRSLVGGLDSFEEHLKFGGHRLCSSTRPAHAT